MISLVKKYINSYTSYVLAISKDERSFDQKLIVFSKDYKSIKMIDYWRKIKDKKSKGYFLYSNAFIYDYDKSDFIETEKWSGLSSIVNNDELLKKLENNQKVKVDEIVDLKKYAKKIVMPKWFEVVTDQDIDNLGWVSTDFHDASLVAAKMKNNNLYLKFNGMFCDICINFIGIIEENLIGKVYEIFDSEIKKEDDYYIWIINDAWSGWVNGTNCDKISGVYIKCEKILWNFNKKFK